MIAEASAATPVSSSTAPTRSGRAGVDTGSLRRMRVAVPIRATTPTGTLIRKIDPYQNRVRSRPPSTGPMATPSPTTAGHSASTRRLPSSVSSVANSPKMLGTMNAAPIPMPARDSTSAGTEGANAPSSEAAVNTPTPRA